MLKSLKQFFKDSEITQSQLAQKLGINRSAITHWINGDSKPAREHLAKLSEITGIPIEDLL